MKSSFPARDTDHVWGVVLSDSFDCRRARRRLHGPDGSGPALFGQALQRAARLIPADRLVAVLTREQSGVCDLGGAARAGVHRVVQPAWRGSAAETFLPVLKIAAADREAIVALFPGSPPVEGEARFMSYVAKAVDAVIARPELPIVLGASPGGPATGCSWIEPGSPVDGLEAYAVRAVRRFVPRPSPAEAMALWEGDGLVNTGVVVAKARTLITLGARYLPDVLESFEPLGVAFGTPEEPLLCEAVYEQMPYAALAHALFGHATEAAVLPVAHVRLGLDATAPVRALAS